MKTNTTNIALKSVLALILAESKKLGISDIELAKRSGISLKDLNRMKDEGSGNISALEAMASVVGVKLKPGTNINH